MRRFAIRISVSRVLPIALVALAACFPTFEFGPVPGAADASGDAVSDDGPSESGVDDATDESAVDAAVDEDTSNDASSADDAG
jgi:hypothetical protein